MMQKMGWKSGNASSRKQERGGENTTESKVESGSSSDGTNGLKNSRMGLTVSLRLVGGAVSVNTHLHVRINISLLIVVVI